LQGSDGWAKYANLILIDDKQLVGLWIEVGE